MNHLDKYYIVKFASSACGPSGCGSSGPPLKSKNDTVGKVRPGTGYGVMKDRAPVTHKAPYQGKLPPNMTPHQFTTMSDLYRTAVQRYPQKYENVEFGQLPGQRQQELINLYQNRVQNRPAPPQQSRAPVFRAPQQRQARPVLL